MRTQTKTKTNKQKQPPKWMHGGGKTFSFETDEINKINCVYIECKKYFPDCGQATESSDII